MSSFEDSYLGQLRAAVGNRKLITPAARAVIRDERGHVLLIRRSDNGEWGMPAGNMELDESVYGCPKREVKEETGLDVLSATLIAVHSEPRFDFVNAFGGEHQMLSFVFRVDRYGGTLKTVTDETIDARFFPIEEVPSGYRETLEDLENFAGQVILK